MIQAIDLFAGPGGWDIAARELGIDPLGIELDDAACETRKAAGHRTEQANVAELIPAEYEPCDLLIASPPCQSFSRAGKREGIADLPKVYEAAQRLAHGEGFAGLDWADPRSALVLEPLRWALWLEPSYLAWEQVPDVAPFWNACAQILGNRGWQVWTGILEAERYGVPQTRERAILMADRERHVELPRPTHQRYVKGEAQRHEHTLEGEILPWVSMAEALGWGMAARPAGTVVTPRGSGTETGALDGGSGQRAAMAAAMREGDWVYDRRSKSGNGEPVPDREADEPAPTLTAAGLAKGRDRWRLRNGNQENAAERDATEPAPTMAFGNNAARVEWVGERPATSICGDPRVFPPGGHMANDGRDNSKMVGRSENAVRVTLQEAAILQSFPPDYPFQGTKSKCFEQVGNAVPPLLAKAILSDLLGVSSP